MAPADRGVMTLTKVSTGPHVLTVRARPRSSRGSIVGVALVAAWVILIALTLAISLATGTGTGFVTTDVTTPTPSPLPAATVSPSA